MINRDRYLIVKNILVLLSERDRTGSRITYACRLSNEQRKIYLNSMIEKGLIKEILVYGKKNYTITQIGKDVLRVLANLYGLCPFIMDSGNNDKPRTWDIV